ncbi:oligosaccharide flippase family protein [Collinsella sp. AF08-23]|uniref:oligosaccharide flippase family protein n=1 Tax=Collinsella sp. AF08-23 TaxID=2292211 RepID=UPI0013140753|nr:oligosaccharide flippase family protein [Collinsella sp. AF08-23]
MLLHAQFSLEKSIGFRLETWGILNSKVNLAKNVFWQYGLQVLKYVFPFILVPYLTRVLGTGGYAVYAYVLSFMGIVQTFADFGFMLSGTKRVIDLRDEKKELCRLLGSITMARIALALILCVGVFCASQFIPLMRNNMFYVLVAFLATVTRALLPDFIFQGFEDMGPLTTRFFVSKIVSVGLTLILVRAPQDLVLVALADFMGGLVALVWSFATARNRYGVQIARTGIGEVLSELKSSAVYCISNIGTTLVSGFTTFVVGVVLTNPTDVAYWSLALTTVSAVQALYTPISNSLYPYVMSHQDLGLAKKLGLLAAPALIIGTIAYCLLSPQIFLLLGGEEYVKGSWVMVALAAVLPLSFYSILIGWPVLGAMGRVKELTASTLVSGLVNAALLFGISMLGQASLLSICVVRCVAEGVLLASRALALAKCRSRG